MVRRIVLRLLALVGGALAATVSLVPPPVRGAEEARGPYLSPLGLAMASDGSTLYVSEHTANRVAALALPEGAVSWTAETPAGPAGVAVSRVGTRVFVACSEADVVAVVDPRSRQTRERIEVGDRPWGLALSADGSRLYVCNRFSDDVSVVDAAAMKEIARVPLVREPAFCALSASTNTLVVTNMLARGSNHDPTLAAEVSFVDTATNALAGSLRLPTGCNEAMQVACSPDGRFAYVVSLLSRFLVPPTQIERGWINTNALSIVDVANRSLVTTVLLDDLDLGAANPYGAAVSPDGSKLYVTHQGSHEISVVHLPALHAKIDAMAQAERDKLRNDLTFLYRNDLRERYAAGGVGARDVALAPDGSMAYVANYFSGAIAALPTADMERPIAIPLGDEPEMDLVRQGEMLFADGRLCFQQWQSCLSCHPDARSDGLMWDLMNDGIGNPKNAKSLLLSGETPPNMSSGIRADMPVAALAGVRYILFREPEPVQTEALIAYINSLKPAESPLLDDGPAIAAAIARGRALFESEETGCAHCHSGPYFTNLQMADVGTRSQYDRRDDFDTPTLIELFRTAPYLHDGTAVTLHDVLTTRNPEDRHGKTSHLSDTELDDLATYLESL